MIRLLLLALALPTLAAAGPVQLGEVDLRDAKDWDMVRLPPCAGPNNATVQRIGLRVSEHPAEIDHLKVTFHNGGEQVLQVRERFAPGTTSRWIDLDGPARCIASIRIVGDAQSLGWRPGKQAHVAFFGEGGGAAAAGPEAADGRAGSTPDARQDGGQRLGAVRLNDRKAWDLLRFGACSSPDNRLATAVRLTVQDHPAQIDRVVVTFQNGGRQEVSVRKRFAPGSSSVWHDLDGPARCIQSVRIVGDTESLGWRPGKQATVVVHAR